MVLGAPFFAIWSLGRNREHAMHIQSHPFEIHSDRFVRRRCRNQRCGGKLKQETDNSRNAFCCRGCFESYFRKCCLVCERPLRRKAEQQRFCSSKCKFAYRRHPERFLGVWAQVPDAQRSPPTSAHKSGLKTGAKADRPFRLIAGSQLSPRSLALASLPLDPQTAARVRQANGCTVTIGRRDWPIDWIGGGDHQHANKAAVLRRKSDGST